jgi:hypothetical protein
MEVLPVVMLALSWVVVFGATHFFIRRPKVR